MTRSVRKLFLLASDLENLKNAGRGGRMRVGPEGGEKNTAGGDFFGLAPTDTENARKCKKKRHRVVLASLGTPPPES